MTDIPWMSFPELRAMGLAGGITLRVPGVPQDGTREEMLATLRPMHEAAAQALVPGRSLVTAEQVHGAEIAIVETPDANEYAQCDALVTVRDDVLLGIVVADCCPVWISAPERAGCGVIHAGRKGMEEGIVSKAVEMLAVLSGIEPSSIRAFLGPCIRIPDYEVDLPGGILNQLAALGVGEVHDCGLNTAEDLKRFYSYRREKGATGRMMAMGGLF